MTVTKTREHVEPINGVVCASLCLTLDGRGDGSDGVDYMIGTAERIEHVATLNEERGSGIYTRVSGSHQVIFGVAQNSYALEFGAASVLQLHLRAQRACSLSLAVNRSPRPPNPALHSHRNHHHHHHQGQAGRVYEPVPSAV
jgi:hypothetical protein